MSAEPVVEHDVDRLARFVQGDSADLPTALDRDLPDVPDRGDRLAGVLTLVRLAVLDAEHGGDGGDSLSGAVSLMRQQLDSDEG